MLLLTAPKIKINTSARIAGAGYHEDRNPVSKDQREFAPDGRNKRLHALALSDDFSRQICARTDRKPHPKPRLQQSCTKIDRTAEHCGAVRHQNRIRRNQPHPERRKRGRTIANDRQHVYAEQHHHGEKPAAHIAKRRSIRKSNHRKHRRAEKRKQQERSQWIDVPTVSRQISEA